MAHRMLYTRVMSRTFLALLLVAASGSVASAGTFVGLGIGTNIATTGDTNVTEGGRSGRLEVGYRFGRFSIDGIGTRADMNGPYMEPPTLTTLGVAGKYNLPLGDNFEAFGRLGVQHMMLDTDRDSFSGNGLFGGGGFEYRINAIAAGLSLYVDYTIAHASVSSPMVSNPTFSGVELGVTGRFWTLGATVSF